MMNDKIAALLNQQVNKEFYSAYLYLDIANFYDDQDLDGYANYYMIQAQEERDHALEFIRYMQSNNLKVTLEAIDKPDKVFSTVLDPLVAAAAHERYVTGLINAIYREAHEAKDFRTMKFLDWFVNEQMEEEDNADTMVSRYKLFGNDPRGLYLLDQEYAGRTYTAPNTSDEQA
ncbi:MAG: ferritin [Oscillospiraceae bacterium]